MGPPSIFAAKPVIGVAAATVPRVDRGAVAASGLFSRIGFALLVPFLFFLFSRLLDVTLPGLHLPLILGALTTCAVLLTGEMGTVLRMTAAKWILLFTLWFCLASIFGMWRGGSYGIFREYWTKSLLIMLTIPCVAITQERIRVLLRVIGVGLTAVMLVGLAAGETLGGRLTLSKGEYANSNAMGMFAVIGLLLCWHSVTYPGRRRLTAIWWGASTIPMFQVVLRSGSRAALVMLAAMCVYLFWRSSLREKLLAAVVLIPVAVISFISAPEGLLKRFSTVYLISVDDLGPESSEGEASAVESSVARLHHLKTSLLVTIQHPLWGVGPGQYMGAEEVLSKTEGRRASWQYTHNGFTEISSETGIPGLLFYLAALVSVWRGLGKLLARAGKAAGFEDVRHTAKILRMLFVVLAVGIFFGISLYQYFVPAFMGLALGLLRSSDARLGPVAENLRTR